MKRQTKILLSIGGLAFAYYVFAPSASPDPDKALWDFLRDGEACVHPRFYPIPQGEEGRYELAKKREVAKLKCQAAVLDYEYLKMVAIDDPNCRPSLFDEFIVDTIADKVPCPPTGLVWTDPPAVAALLQQINKAQHE